MALFTVISMNYIISDLFLSGTWTCETRSKQMILIYWYDIFYTSTQTVNVSKTVQWTILLCTHKNVMMRHMMKSFVRMMMMIMLFSLILIQVIFISLTHLKFAFWAWWNNNLSLNLKHLWEYKALNSWNKNMKENVGNSQRLAHKPPVQWRLVSILSVYVLL